MLHDELWVWRVYRGRYILDFVLVVLLGAHQART